MKKKSVSEAAAVTHPSVTTNTHSQKSKAVVRGPSWETAVRQVLEDARHPLHYTEIANRVAKIRKVGANPALQVSITLSTSMKKKDSPFLKVGQGTYMLKGKLNDILVAETDNASGSGEQEDIETGAIRAFGMFWDRSSVNWKPINGSLLGCQPPSETPVDFAAQVGIYLLHDRDRVIYIGRVTDASLYGRLRAHTTGRLGGRWDRFSWFGLRGVEEDGKLKTPEQNWSHVKVIETLEALLIESLEPPLNRRRGDNLQESEFLQVEDPTFKKEKKKKEIEDILERL